MSSAVALVSALVLARLLGTGGYGSYAAAIALAAGLAQPSALGLDLYAVREVAVRSARGEWGPLRGLLRGGGSLLLAASGALALLAGAVALAAGGGTGLSRDVLLALPLLPLTALTLVLAGGLQGLQRVTGSLLASILAPRLVFLVLVGVVWLAAGDVGSDAAVLLQVAGASAGLLLAALLLRRAVPPEARAAPPGTAPAGWLRASLPLGLSAGLTVATWHLATLAAGALGSATEAGLYAAAAQLSIVLVVLFEAVRTPFGPVIARLWAAGEHERLQRGLTAATRRVLAATVLAGAVVAVLAEPLLSLFGSGFEDGAPALRAVVAVHVVNAVAAFPGLVLVMTGHERQVASAALVSFAVMIAALALLVPPLGAEGAALALVAATVVRNVVNGLQTRRLTGLAVSALGRRSAR